MSWDSLRAERGLSVPIRVGAWPRLVLIVLGVLSVASAGRAQDTANLQFQLQPGFAVADFYSAAEGVRSTTAFSVRFQTRFPTAVTWLTPIVGATFTPYGSTGSTVRNSDAPTLFVGAVFQVPWPDEARWLAVEIPLLVVHAPGASTGSNPRDYGRDLVVQPTLYLHVGRRLFGDFGPLWSHFDLFTMLEQNLTPNRTGASGKRDRFNPVLTAGASLTLGRANEKP